MQVYEEKFIAFVDILGFDNLIRRFEKEGDSASAVEKIVKLLSKFGSSNDEDFANIWPYFAFQTVPDIPIGNARDLANYREQIESVRGNVNTLLLQLEKSEEGADARALSKIAYLKMKLQEILASKNRQLEDANQLAQPFLERFEPSRRTKQP